LSHLLTLNYTSDQLEQSNHSFRGQNVRLIRAGILLGIIVVGVLYFSGPIYHILNNNIRSLWKNVVYSLIFLAPLGGYFIAWAIGLTERINERAGRLVTLITLTTLVILFVDFSLDLHRDHQNGWPNVENVVTYLKEAGLAQDSHILAEAAPIYEYYFKLEPNSPVDWSSSWYGYYQESDDSNNGENITEGPEVIIPGVQNQHYDFVILDDYYAPGIRQVLNRVLAEADYKVTYEEEQFLPDGNVILLQVFEPRKKQ